MGMCPKCGCGVMVGPTYSPRPIEAPGMICPYPQECLIYRCQRCGYVKSTDIIAQDGVNYDSSKPARSRSRRYHA